MTQNDSFFMQEALVEAKKAFTKGEVPVGAVLVVSGKVIARSHNLVETSKDASQHAELLCLQQGAAILQNWRLLGCTLYSTLEPCSMCAGAMHLFRISRLVWGAPDIRHGAHGSWINLFSNPHPIHNIEITSGVLAEECSQIMKDFFQIRRKRTDAREPF